MLIITETEHVDLTPTLKVEGKLLAPWIGESESACDTARDAMDDVRLDLFDVTFVDAKRTRVDQKLAVGVVAINSSAKPLAAKLEKFTVMGRSPAGATEWGD